MVGENLNGWIEVFRGGRQLDSTGHQHDGDRLIENAVKTFDPAQHEPPVVVGHPQHDSPAFGWVHGIRKVIKNGVVVMEVKLKQVMPEFSQAVTAGRFKKRSAAFYKDGRLRHIGFLGGMPPAIKGLADVAAAGCFAQASYASFEFASNDDWPDSIFDNLTAYV